MPKCKDAYKDINKYRAYARRNNLKYYDRLNFGDGVRRRYEPEEIDMIIEHSIPDRDLAQMFHKSVRSIQVTRNRYKKKRGLV